MDAITILGLVLGGLVGLIMGLTGAGGGILAVPLLLFGLHLSVASAAPVALLAVGIAAAMGALIGLRAGIVRYRAAMLVAGIGIVVTPFGSWLARQMDTRYLTLLFALVLAYVAFRGWRESRGTPGQQVERIACPCVRDPQTGRFVWTRPCAIRLSVTGCVAGLLSGLLGVGGGFVIVPSLQRFTDLTMRATVATSLAVIALVSLANVGTSIYGGHFDFALGVPFSIGAVLGMLLGGRLASRWPAQRLKQLFFVMCLVVAASMLVKGGMGLAG